MLFHYLLKQYFSWQSALRNAFQRRNLDAFKFALVNGQANPNHVDTDNGITIFEEILQTPNSASFITLCIDNGADLYEVREEEEEEFFWWQGD